MKQRPTWLDENEFPFKSHYFSTPHGEMHYVDEGAGDPIVFVPGNPSWSFEARNVIKVLSGQFRCIAVDHIGFGLSDKPQDFSHTPKDHAANLEALLDSLKLERITFVVGDWGGPIGLSYAIKYPEKTKSAVITNTFLWSVKNDWYYQMFSAFMGGALGGWGAHHSQCLEAWFQHIPGLRVVIPSTPADAKGLLKSAIRDDNPVLFVEHRGLYAARGEVPGGDHVVPLGVAAIRRSGRDVTLLALSRMVSVALEAAEELAAQGISVEVIDPRSLAPLDLDTIVASVKKTGRLVVVHEAVVTGGVGAELAARVQEAAFDYLDSPILRVGAPFAPVPASLELEKLYVPGAARVASAVRDTLGENA